MSFISQLQQVDKRLASSFVVAIALAIISFVAGQLYETRPKLQYQILSNAPVYDLRENLTTLDILFEGKSIRQENQTLTLITVRIENVGNAGISKQTSFDESYLPGLKVPDSKIVRADILTANNDYLKNALQLTRTSDNEFTLGPSIFDKNDFVVIKLLVLHSEALQPQLQSFGKVAGCPPIEVIPAATVEDKRGFFTRALEGELTIQGFRLITYFAGFLALVFIVGAIISYCSDLVETGRRKRHIKLFQRSLGSEPQTRQHQTILALYLESGARSIVRLKEVFSNSELLRAYHGKTSGAATSQQIFDPLWREDLFHRGTVDTSSSVGTGKIIADYTTLEQDGSVIVDPVAIEVVRRFEEFLVHQVPEEVFQARRQTQTVPFGTESTSPQRVDDNEPSITPPPNA